MASQRHVRLLPSSKAPWRPLFQSHISKLTPPEFSLATVYKDSSGAVYPRVRTCIFRGFWTELDLRETARKQLLEDDRGREENGVNPNVYESDLLTFTTDVRMDKIAQISSSSEETYCGNDAGAGGPVEAVFWIRDVMTQWRIKGRAFIIGGDNRGAGESRSRENIWQWVRRRENSADENVKRWSLEKEITAIFANLSPMMRGSFKNPPPGTPRSEPPTNRSLQLGQRVDDIYDPLARANFRVVVIVPEEVESVDFTSPDDSKRMRWTLTKTDENVMNVNSGEYCQRIWEVVEVWP
ncbi:hypothetical protein AJ78_03086 [Emergomyces pasteurianus Ep9510]|uniref:Pyridoxamine 5'-phosphate oxidase Alr4036 family FMN-binding domain-containing protein n=1 Tax=Emergomyces pasteurianus Ep9510 TaxID=1447872 RepID=A0A1J9QLN1_9EURO|nr:hypothetical protein AJ78_03086 [Emergomyces pasteurianus Ep9510]